MMKMNSILRKIGVTLISSVMALAMAVPVTAQDRPGRGGGNGGNHAPKREHKVNQRHTVRPTQQVKKERPTPQQAVKQRPEGTRPGNGGNRPGNGGNRPGNGTSRPNDNHGLRPGANGGNNNNRPGSIGNRPGNNHNRPDQGMNRPGNGGNRPGNGGNRPGHNNWRPNPGPTPPPPAGRPHRPGYTWQPAPPPHRPYRPVMRPWRPPVPPPAWRPAPNFRGPSFATILGVALGTALYNSVNALIAEGYNVDGYQNGVVYLRDVNQYNYYWPDATLRYNDAGNLIGSEYIYSTPIYDVARYSNLYNTLYSQYGMPASSIGPGGGALSATWFGPNQCYITLEYSPVTIGGVIRYCTTLSQGLYY